MSKFQHYLSQNLTDAIIYLGEGYLQAAEDPNSRQDAVHKLSDLLISIHKDRTRLDAYLNSFCGKFKWLKKKDLSEIINALAAENEEEKNDDVIDMLEGLLPKGVDPQKYLNQGFYQLKDGKKTGYYFPPNGQLGKRPYSRSNFIIDPLFQLITNDEESSFLMELDNGRKKGFAQVPAENFVKVDPFRGTMINKGCLWKGNAEQLLTLVEHLLDRFPKAMPLKTLGWQREGFFAWYNAVWHKGTIKRMDQNGIIKIAEDNFFSPASSRLNEGVREENDSYEQDKFMAYKESPVTFSQWADLMSNAFGKERAALAVSFVILSIFRDLVFKINSTCPYLYAYGQVQSGKSAYANRIKELFFSNTMRVFNLNQGTDFAFFNNLGRFSNVPMIFNEFDENAIKDTWYRALKGVYDGEGRQRGSGKKDKVEEQKVSCTLVLLGQYLSTKDDASVLSRSIPVEFKKPSSRPDTMVNAFNELVKLGEAGMGGIITELLSLREHFTKTLTTEYATVFTELKSLAVDKSEDLPKERILRNYTAILSVLRCAAQKMPLNIDLKWFTDYCAQQVVDLTEMIEDNDALAVFWNTMETLLDMGAIEEGFDFKIESAFEIKIQTNKGTEIKKFDEVKNVLFLRLNRVVNEYMKNTRSSTGQIGLNKVNIQNYIKQDDKIYLGNVSGTRFKGAISGQEANTSAIALDYDALKVNLIRKQEQTQIEITGIVKSAPVMEISASGYKLYSFVFGHSDNQKDYKIYMEASALVNDIREGIELKIKGTKRKNGGFMLSDFETSQKYSSESELNF